MGIIILSELYACCTVFCNISMRTFHILINSQTTLMHKDSTALYWKQRHCYSQPSDTISLSL